MNKIRASLWVRTPITRDFRFVMVICVDTVTLGMEVSRRKLRSCKGAKSFVHEGNSSYLLL